MRHLFRSVVAALALLTTASLVAPNAQAQTITFGGLSGPNGNEFTSLSEAGFTVTSSDGYWQQGLAFGNAAPSIYSSSNSASVTVTRNGGGLFQLLGFDIGNGDSGSMSFFFEGFNNSALSYTSATAAGPTTPPFFLTYDSPTSALFDAVRITVLRGQTTTYNIDNIRLASAAVPEPSSLLLLLAGGSALLITAHRRRRA